MLIILILLGIHKCLCLPKDDRPSVRHNKDYEQKKVDLEGEFEIKKFFRPDIRQKETQIWIE